ncbi:hypothetical protein D9M71_362670 [compost metagenome]
MGHILLKQLQRKTAALDLCVGLGHLVVGSRDIKEKRQDRGHHQQADGGRNHQLDETESRLPTANETSGRNAAKR